MSISVFEVFRSFKWVQIFILSMISGMPFALLYTVIAAWLKDGNVALSVITTFAIARLPYSLKWTWSPIIDNIKMPILYNLLGKRRSWMVVTSVLISTLVYICSNLNPQEDTSLFKIICIGIGFLAATYDICWDAMRIEMLSKEEQGFGIAVANYGFRIGALTIGGGGLFIAEYLDSWQAVYQIISLIFGTAALFILTVNHKVLIQHKIELKTAYKMVYDPFKEFFSRPYAILVLFSVVFYKIGDAMLSIVGTPFYMEMGFSKMDIAVVVKTYAFIATLIGCYVGAVVCGKLGMFRGLMVCGVIEAMTNLGYIWIYHEPTYGVFTFAVVLENFTAGLGAVALGTYVSNLCNKQYTATHFALLSSAATLMNNSLTTYAGTLAEKMGWSNYFVFTTVIAIPALFLLWYLHKKINWQNLDVAAKN